MSWIDPNFVQAGRIINANDDHAPSDVYLGQEGVKEVFQAILESELYDRILFIITYDEHGGFYDHMNPKNEIVHDDYDHMVQRGYGVRVPTIIVSPHILEKSASHEVFDHTSILKTILIKYCNLEEGDKQADWMSKRVEYAKSVADLLTEDIDIESLTAKKNRLLKKLEEMAERFERYHDYLDRIIAKGDQTQGYTADHEPTHL